MSLAKLASVCLGLCLMLTSGCVFRELRRNVEEIDRWALLGGAIEGDASSGVTVVVLLRSDTREAIDSFALGSRGKYFFRVPAGEYMIGAFADADRDFSYDPAKERGVWYGAPDAVRVAAGGALDHIDLVVSDAAARVIDHALTAPELGRRGMRDLPDSRRKDNDI